MRNGTRQTERLATRKATRACATSVAAPIASAFCLRSPHPHAPHVSNSLYLRLETASNLQKTKAPHEF
jgi:hypothetical protein